MVGVKQLKKLGCMVDVVDNGLEAVKAWQRDNYQRHPDGLPDAGMDGYDAARKIRELETTQNLLPVRIIAMTAHAMQGDRERCLAAGMDDYISKPVDVKVLKAVLEKIPAENAGPEKSSGPGDEKNCRTLPHP